MARRFSKTFHIYIPAGYYQTRYQPEHKIGWQHWPVFQTYITANSSNEALEGALPEIKAELEKLQEVTYFSIYVGLKTGPDAPWRMHPVQLDRKTGNRRFANR